MDVQCLPCHVNQSTLSSIEHNEFSFLRTLYLRVQQLSILCVGNWVKQAGNQHGWVRICYTNWGLRVHNQWKQEHVNWGEYMDMAEMSNDGIRESQVKSGTGLGKGRKNNQKRSCESTGHKTKSKESLSCDMQAGWTSDDWYSEGWGAQSPLCLNLHQAVKSPISFKSLFLWVSVGAVMSLPL